MLYTNIDGLLNKKDELTLKISHPKPDIIALTEIKKIKKNQPLLNEYKNS